MPMRSQVTAQFDEVDSNWQQQIQDQHPEENAEQLANSPMTKRMRVSITADEAHDIRAPNSAKNTKVRET